MNPKNSTFILRLTISIILIMHSIPSMLDGGVNGFGEFYLAPMGFGALGIPIAWLIKLSHVAAVVALLMDKYIKLAAFGTIFILIMGIVIVHYPEGWYVVGGGRNGMEFNILLIAALITIAFPKGLVKG